MPSFYCHSIKNSFNTAHSNCHVQIEWLFIWIKIIWHNIYILFLLQYKQMVKSHNDLEYLFTVVQYQVEKWERIKYMKCIKKVVPLAGFCNAQNSCLQDCLVFVYMFATNWSMNVLHCLLVLIRRWLAHFFTHVLQSWFWCKIGKKVIFCHCRYQRSCKFLCSLFIYSRIPLTVCGPLFRFLTS